MFFNYYQRVAREVKNTKNYFLNWPTNHPIRLGDYGFYRGRRVEFDWQGNISSFGIKMKKIDDRMPMSESCRSAGKVSVSFDTSASAPASAKIGFANKNSIAFESHGGIVERLELDPLHLGILEAQRDGKVSWNSEWVIITQIYRVESFSSFISGTSRAHASIIAKLASPASIFGLADPSIGLELGSSDGMASASVASKGAIPYFVISKLKGYGLVTRLERYG